MPVIDFMRCNVGRDALRKNAWQVARYLSTYYEGSAQRMDARRVDECMNIYANARIVDASGKHARQNPSLPILHFLLQKLNTLRLTADHRLGCRCY